MDRKKAVSILGVIVLVILAVFSYFLSRKDLLTQRRTTINKAAETTLPDPKTMIFSIPDNVSNFPILNFSSSPVNPALNEEPVCYTGDNRSREWMLWDVNNDSPVCRDTDNSSTFCSGADLAKETETVRFCYWKNDKKFNLGINTQNMKYQGCYIARDAEHANYPGGYSTYVMWRAINRPDFLNNLHFNLDLLESVKVQAKVSTDFYSQSSCPVTPNPPVSETQLKEFPYYGGSHPAAVPHAFFYFSFMAYNHDLGKTIFYQPQTWDNRYEDKYLKQGKDPKDDPATTYKNCNFSEAKWFVIGEPAGALGAPYARPGAGLISYDVDILPRLKYWINVCMNEVNNTNKEYDLSGWRISGLNFGNEEGNTPIMTNTLVDPKVVTTIRNDVNINAISTSQPGTLSGNRITSAIIATASSSRSQNELPYNAVDNNPDTNWHSGGYPVQSLELDLQSEKAVTGLQFRLNQSPNGFSRWKIYGGNTKSPTTLLQEVNGITRGNEWITIPLQSPAVTRYLKIEAVRDVSHVSIYEVNVFQGAQNTIPTAIPTTPVLPTQPSSCDAGSNCMSPANCLRSGGLPAGKLCGNDMICCSNPVSTTTPTPMPTTKITLPSPTQSSVTLTPIQKKPTPTVTVKSSCPEGFSCRTSTQCRSLGGGTTGLTCGTGMYCCFGK